MKPQFDYRRAFSRNIGWLTEAEQQILKTKRIAIAGMGGVGGSHLLTLIRLGICHFNIADFDVFEVENFNRQIGANINSINRPKVNVLAEMATAINPNIDLNIFKEGITEANSEDFLSNVDLYVDGLDFFAVKARRRIFELCHQIGIPAITAAPLGMGAAVLNFLPEKMSFEDYFQLNNLPEEEQLLRFFIGLAPTALQKQYLMDPSTIDLKNHRGPSTSIGCELCAGAAGAQAIKILLQRGKTWAAPHGIQIDAYTNKMKHTWRPRGNNNPVQKLILHMARKRMISNKISPLPSIYSTDNQRPIEKIIDLARWAPSGDNSQPWRFEIKNDHHVVVHGFDTRDHVVYDRQGHASQVSIGALLETISIAATEFSYRINISRQTDKPETQPTFDIHFEQDKMVKPDALIPYIPKRTVQRRPMSTAALTKQQKKALEASLPEGYKVLWLEGLKNRITIAKLMFLNDKLRLTIPEAYEVHQSVIEWKARFSEDKIPEQAIGIDYLTGRIMQWTMKSWDRVAFMNKYFAGTLAPRIQLAFVPALACGAHFVLIAKATPASIDDNIIAGQALQRFWLTLTQHTLHMQPELTPLIFHQYIKNSLSFTDHGQATNLAQQISKKLIKIIGNTNADNAIFMGRIGNGQHPLSRSTRLSLNKLIRYKQ